MLITPASITPSTLALSTAHVKEAGNGTTGTSATSDEAEKRPSLPVPLLLDRSLSSCRLSLLSHPLDHTPFHPASSFLLPFSPASFSLSAFATEHRAEAPLLRGRMLQDVHQSIDISCPPTAQLQPRHRLQL